MASIKSDKYVKVKSILFVLLLVSCSCFSQQIKYSVAKNLWADTLGNHRAVIEVDKNADAVEVKINWRRRDEDAANKAIMITDEKGNRVKNIYRININRERGDFAFEPTSGAGKYFVYYYPWSGRKLDGGFEGDYLKKEKSPDENWVSKNHLSKNRNEKLPLAKVLEIQARTAFDSFYPMEVGLAYSNSFVPILNGRTMN